MKVGKKFRVVLDVAMSVMLVFEMFIQFTGDFLHEVVGFAFFGTIVLHMLLSVSWAKSTARLAKKKGRIGGRRLALAVMGCLLALAIVVLAVSSIAISNLIASTGFSWPLGSYALWAAVHSASAYALCALVAVHLAMHWAFLASAFKVPYDPSRRRAIGAGVHAVAAIGAVALGVTALSQAKPALATDASATVAASDGKHKLPRPEEWVVADTASEKPAEKAEDSAVDPELVASEAPSASESQSTVTFEAPSASEEPEPVAPEITFEEPDQAVSEDTDVVEVSGICTLCRKQCPLSAPRCNKPYDAGLI